MIAKADKIENPWLRTQQALLDESSGKRPPLGGVASALVAGPAGAERGLRPRRWSTKRTACGCCAIRATGPVKHKTPLLFVFALVNRPYILDILPNKSVVAHFVKAGFDTYLIDWGKPTFADRHLNLNSYINGYLRNVVKYLQKRTSSPQVSILGYCMGGTMSAMFTALHPECVKNLILLAAGIDFSTREGLLNLWADARYFDVDAFVDAFGNCPAEYLQACFLMLKPVRNLLAKPVSLFEKLDDKKYVDEFLTMETWLNDNVPVAGEVFREFVKYLYQQNLLVQNRLDRRPPHGESQADYLPGAELDGRARRSGAARPKPSRSTI